MASDFVLKTSSEFGVNVLHCRTRHLYLFGIGEGEDGRRAIKVASCRPAKRAGPTAENYQVEARAFAENAAMELGLIDSAAGVKQIPDNRSGDPFIDGSLLSA